MARRLSGGPIPSEQAEERAGPRTGTPVLGLAGAAQTRFFMRTTRFVSLLPSVLASSVGMT